MSARIRITRARFTKRVFGKRRPYILVGTLLTVPALLALSQVNSIAALIGVICAIQFAVNVATAPYQALIPDLVPKAQQGAASAWMGMSSPARHLARFGVL